MILRRVIEHFRKQEWTAIGIDFVIVVVGVFVGIQVSNWNTQRDTNQRAATFAQRLTADLREEAWGYQYLIEYNRDVLAHAEATVDALTGKSVLSNEELLVKAYRATQYKHRTRRRATYDELISTGTIGLIRDPKLRNTAMRIYNIPTIENTVREAMQSRYRETFRMSVSNEVQRALNRDCGDRYVVIGDYDGIADNIDYPCKLDVPVQQIDEAATALRNNAALVPQLRLRIADLDTRLHDLVVNNKDIVAGLNAVAKKKGEEGN